MRERETLIKRRVLKWKSRFKDSGFQIIRNLKDFIFLIKVKTFVKKRETLITPAIFAMIVADVHRLTLSLLPVHFLSLSLTLILELDY